MELYRLRHVTTQSAYSLGVTAELSANRLRVAAIFSVSSLTMPWRVLGRWRVNMVVSCDSIE